MPRAGIAQESQAGGPLTVPSAELGNGPSERGPMPPIQVGLDLFAVVLDGVLELMAVGECALFRLELRRPARSVLKRGANCHGTRLL
jgi:hypothetical protein